MDNMNKVKKAIVKAALDKVLPKGWKYSLSISSHPMITCVIKSAPVDLLADVQGHPWAKQGYVILSGFQKGSDFLQYTGLIDPIIAALNTGNQYDRDYECEYISHFVYFSIGTPKKHFIVA